MRRGKYLSSIIALSRQPKDNLSCYRPAPGLKSWGGGAGGGGGNFLYMVYYGRACRIAPFFSTARYMIGPLFSNKKYMNGPVFLDSLWGPHFSDILVYAHIFRSEIFRGCLSSWYYMNWLWYLCNNQQKWVQKKIKGQFMNRSIFWMIKYMNGSVFSKARYMNGVGFEILARTPVPKLPLSYRPPPPPPHPPQELKSRHSERCEAVFFKNFSVTIYRPFFFSFFFFFFFFFSFFFFFFFF